jgi:hypothetical protein
LSFSGFISVVPWLRESEIVVLCHYVSFEQHLTHISAYSFSTLAGTAASANVFTRSIIALIGACASSIVLASRIVRKSDNIESANMRMAARRTVSWSTWPGIRSGPPEQRTAEASIGFYTHRFAQSKEYRPLSRPKRRRRSNLPCCDVGNDGPYDAVTPA